MNLNRFEEMTQKEKDEFSRICNMLLSVTYILRDGFDGRLSKEYRFIDSNFDLFYDYLEISGWKIYKDIQYGIIYVRNTDGFNKLSLNKLTTVMLVTMRVVYEESRAQASSTNDVCTTVGALFGKIVNEFSVYPKNRLRKKSRNRSGFWSRTILSESLTTVMMILSADLLFCRLCLLPFRTKDAKRYAMF